MRRYTMIIAVAIAVLARVEAADAQSAVRFAPSGRGTATIEITRADGDTSAPRTVRLDYGQPSLRGRVLHGDSLVPYDRVWRTGANGTSTLATDVDLMIGGVKLPRGRYALFTVPGKSGWKLALQREAGQTVADYDAAKDVVRVDMRRTELKSPVETLTMWLIPSPGQAGGDLRIVWGSSELSVPFTVP